MLTQPAGDARFFATKRLLNYLGVTSRPVARILQLIEAEPKIMAFLIEDKQKKTAVNM